MTRYPKKDLLTRTLRTISLLKVCMSRPLNFSAQLRYNIETMSTDLIEQQLSTKHIILLQALASTPSDMAQFFVDVNDTSAHQTIAPAEWSMIDILEHLIDVETRYRVRLERVIKEDRPTVPTLWPDQATQRLDLSLEELIDCFRVDRVQTLSFLKSLSPEDWQRPAIHETFGETTFWFLVQNLVDHDTLHLNQLRELQRKICGERQIIH